MRILACYAAAWSLAFSTLALAQDAGAPETPAAPAASEVRTLDPAVVVIEGVQTTFQRAGYEERVKVSQAFSLSAKPPYVFERPAGYAIALPQEAFGVEVGEGGQLSPSGREVSWPGPIGAAAVDLAASYYLPLKGGQAVLQQTLPAPAGAATAILTWIEGGAALRGQGFEMAETRELSNGLMARVAVAREPTQLLHIMVLGLSEDPAATERGVTLAICLLLLAAGLAAYLRARFAQKRSAPEGAP